ncbi:MAG: bifunctional heptose 7-phosphate kinase/heptose 1-phosphate adenyltransferase [Bdellovibrionales bacterium]
MNASKSHLKENLTQVLKRLPQMKGRKMIIVGDSGLDEYVFGRVRRISPEAPVPIVEVVDDGTTDYRLGLSTNVAQNITSLGGVCHLISVIGDDPAGQSLKGILDKAKVSPEHLVVDETRPTTRKLRVMTGQHHIVRVDYEHQRFVSSQVETKILDRAKKLIADCDGLIIQDYAKGVVSESCAQALIQLAKKHNKKVFVDPHRSTPMHYYRGSDVMTPNHDEAMSLSRLSFDELRKASDSLQEVADTIRQAVQSPTLVITRGKDGMSLYENTNTIQIPTFARQVFDVAGAGDTVIAALSMAWASGFSLQESCLIGNMAAGVVVGKIGCVPCHYSELESWIQQHTENV